MSLPFLFLSLFLWILGGGSPLLREQALGAEVGERNPQEASDEVPSLDDEAVIQEGAALFTQSCAVYCHGPKGIGGRGPRLRGRQFDKDYLFNIISNGRDLMPPFKEVYTREEIWKLVAYVLSLSNAEGK
jgi:mono/diheme cytochrome c family protein